MPDFDGSRDQKSGMLPLLVVEIPSLLSLILKERFTLQLKVVGIITDSQKK